MLDNYYKLLTALTRNFHTILSSNVVHIHKNFKIIITALLTGLIYFWTRIHRI
jgi:hypothetical protein